MNNQVIDLEWDPVHGVYRKLTPVESTARGVIRDLLYLGAALVVYVVIGRALS